MDQMKVRLFPSLEGRICAEYRVVAEPERARERGEEETRRVLDLIWFSVPAIYPTAYNIRLGLMGEVWRTVQSVIDLSADFKSFTIHDAGVGPLAAFELNTKNIAKMEKLGVFAISNVLQKNEKDLNDFEDALIRAVHWFSSSLASNELENKFLYIMISMECLLTPKEREPVGNYIAEGIALILASDVNQRKSLKKTFRDLYAKRSAVSHGGRKKILSRDVEWLTIIGESLIMRLVHNREKFDSRSQLLKWIETAKLSGNSSLSGVT